MNLYLPFILPFMEFFDNIYKIIAAIFTHLMFIEVKKQGMIAVNEKNHRFDYNAQNKNEKR